MIRPAERFAVNIAKPDAGSPSSRAAGWMLSPAAMLTLAAVVGVGIGGTLPTRHAPFGGPAQMARDLYADPTAIEPAAGPPSAGGTVAAGQDALTIARAPDGAFYAAVALDAVPITVRLEPGRRASVLTPRDAARLLPGGVAAPTLRVAELTLGGHVGGPEELAVGDAEALVSVLGAVDRDHLRLAAR